MNQQIIIGTQGNQPFSIPDSYVGRQHAILRVDQNGRYFLIDNGSKNGTFIFNGTSFERIYPNQPYPVTPETMIQLGPQTRFHIRRILPALAPVSPNPGPKPQPKPEPKQVDISHLRGISQRYEDQKLKIESKIQGVNGLRGLTIIISLGAGTLGAVFGGGDDVMKAVISVGSAAILIAILLTLINNYSKKLMRMRKDNETQYAVKYVCPECHVSFRGKIYENILAERSCPRCKTKYYEKNMQPS